MRFGRRTVAVAFAAFSSLGLAACGDDEKDPPPEDHGHDPESPSCAQIMDVCHAADEGSGPAHDCHDVAHADVEAYCAPQKDACIATCNAVLGDAGS
jgi:hypothetical protein